MAHVRDMAEHLGLDADVMRYNATLKTLSAAYHTLYWDPTASSYRGGTQTANLLPLLLDIPTPQARQQAEAALVQSLAAHSNTTTSGIVGAAFVLDALLQAGRGDIALEMALKTTRPSWGFMVTQGPGTIWETWTDSSNSHNHPALTASIGTYLYRIAGIDPRSWTDGVVSFNPEPNCVRTIRSASAEVDTAHGLAAVQWSYSSSLFYMHATVPHGARKGRLYLHVPPDAQNTPATTRMCLSVDPPELTVGRHTPCTMADDVVCAAGGAEGLASAARQWDNVGRTSAVVLSVSSLSPRNEPAQVILEVVSGTHAVRLQVCPQP